MSGTASCAPTGASSRPDAGAAAVAEPDEAFARHRTAHPRTARYCVACSGGRDSHVLLHLVERSLRDDPAISLRALHIDHGLSPDSARWADHCRTVCERLGVALAVRRVEVRPDGHGPEAAARAARHGAFADELGVGEHLLLAHHADDQAETFLLRALRGSGPDGLGAMPALRPFARGCLARPLLECSSDAIAAYAARHALHWIEDPSNAGQRFDRNFLRHEILPRLRKRWPAAVRTLGRSAGRSAAASRTLMELADRDLDALRLPGGDQLSVPALRRLPRERAHGALRAWLRRSGRPMPRLQDLAAVFDQLVRTGPDTSGRVRVGGDEFRRHADRLYLLPVAVAPRAFEHPWPAPYAPLRIAEIGRRITREEAAGFGLCLPHAARVTVRSRIGGERIGLGGSAWQPPSRPRFHKTVKKLLQEAGVPAWERGRVPLLFADERLAAVWGIAVASDFRQPRPDGHDGHDGPDSTGTGTGTAGRSRSS